MAFRPWRIGLTGGVGAGKSEVLRLLARKGIPTLQTDRVGHVLLRQRKVARKLAKLFGKGILKDNGSIDRRALGDLVFRDSRKRELLNRSLHPLIRKRVAEWSRGRKARPGRYGILVIEVPLLFERGYSRWFDASVSVSASRPSRTARLRKKGWTSSRIRRRERAQWSPGRKDKASDWVIPNQGDLKALKTKVEDWLEWIQLKRSKQGGRRSS